jgi:hypothetical protein
MENCQNQARYGIPSKPSWPKQAKTKQAIRKPSKIRNNCKGSLYIILNVLLNKTNLIYIAISAE